MAPGIPPNLSLHIFLLQLVTELPFLGISAWLSNRCFQLSSACLKPAPNFPPFPPPQPSLPLAASIPINGHSIYLITRAQMETVTTPQIFPHHGISKCFQALFSKHTPKATSFQFPIGATFFYLLAWFGGHTWLQGSGVTPGNSELQALPAGSGNHM